MRKRSWPHPVLDAEGNDYPNCAFQAAIEARQTRKEFILNARYDLGSETLSHAADEGKAVFALHLHCAKTSFREAYQYSVPEFEVRIPESLLRDVFTARPFLVSAKQWSLTSKEFAPIFSGMQFEINPGYILAIAPPIEFPAEKQIDELRSIKSVFHIIPHKDANRQIVEFDFTHERIAIVLPHRDFERYGLFRKRMPFSQLFACSLVLPALQHALMVIKEEDEEGVGRTRWRRVLKRRLIEIGKQTFEVDDSFAIAQELLDLPYSRAFEAVAKAAETEE